jgi:hypothetical protein
MLYDIPIRDLDGLPENVPLLRTVDISEGFGTGILSGKKQKFVTYMNFKLAGCGVDSPGSG